MKKIYIIRFIPLFIILIIYLSCSSDDPVVYTEIPVETPVEEEPVSPVVIDFNAVPFPYARLSEYNFFEGQIKEQRPSYKVIPYDLSSTLFTDYALKKRFVWMPSGSKATYTADGEILDFPSGTVLIKTFYYDNVQPDNSTKLIETRLMIKKNEQWIFANYIWNEQQTEAYLDLNGSFTNISWKQGEEIKNTNYRIPSGAECFTCHKNNGTAMPIGPKPQNLNRLYNYSGTVQNQLQKLVAEGYLDASNLPADIVSTIDWTDTGKPIEERVRSYLDINCAHCHREGSHCDYMPMRLAYNETANPANMGVCVPATLTFSGETYIVAGGSAARSVMHYRLNSTNEAERMPLLGRTVKHTEGVQLIEQWINGIETPCP